MVLRKIRKLSNVRKSVTVYGEYDLVLEVEIENIDKLDAFIFDTLRMIPGVESTTTLITTRIPS
jgi:DNA-binding Lrp family transcriptional regulator